MDPLPYLFGTDEKRVECTYLSVTKDHFLLLGCLRKWQFLTSLQNFLLSYIPDWPLICSSTRALPPRSSWVTEYLPQCRNWKILEAIWCTLDFNCGRLRTLIVRGQAEILTLIPPSQRYSSFLKSWFTLFCSTPNLWRRSPGNVMQNFLQGQCT